MRLAFGLAALALPFAPARASQPDLLEQARYQCTECVARMPSHLARCAAKAEERSAFGDVIVTLSLTPGTDRDSPEYARGTVTASATDGLGPKVARCVEAQLRQLDCLPPCYVDQGFPLDMPIGSPRPLLPPAPELLPRWHEYKDSSWLTRWWRRRRFQRSLAADIRLTPEGCLWIPDALNLHAGLVAWEKGLGQGLPPATLVRFPRGPTEARWPASWDRGYQVTAEDAILIDEGPSRRDRPDWRDYDGSAGVRICLLPLTHAR